MAGPKMSLYLEVPLYMYMYSNQISGDRLRWDSDTSLTDASGSDFKSTNKISLAGSSSQVSKLKKGSWKKSYTNSSSPLRREGGRRGKDSKLKSEKKLSLGRRKGGGKTNSSRMVTLADLAQSVPRASTSGKGTGMGSPSIGNGSVGHGDQMMQKGSMELELCDAATPSSGSRKSYYSQEEESSLSERKSVAINKFLCTLGLGPITALLRISNLLLNDSCTLFMYIVSLICSVSTNRFHISSVRTTANRHGPSFIRCHDNNS